MVEYRRNFVAGGTYFFTVVLHDRDSDLLTRHVDLLRASVRATASSRPFDIDAAVILPEHLHMIWTLPADDADYAGRWRAIKSGFVRRLVRHGVTVAYNRRREAQVWQRRYWERTVRDESDYRIHVDYIHYNPVRHGHVARPVEWMHSSIHRYIRKGILTADWAAEPDEATTASFGEPA